MSSTGRHCCWNVVRFETVVEIVRMLSQHIKKRIHYFVDKRFVGWPAALVFTIIILNALPYKLSSVASSHNSFKNCFLFQRIKICNAKAKDEHTTWTFYTTFTFYGVDKRKNRCRLDFIGVDFRKKEKNSNSGTLLFSKYNSTYIGMYVYIFMYVKRYIRNITYLY